MGGIHPFYFHLIYIFSVNTEMSEIDIEIHIRWDGVGRNVIFSICFHGYPLACRYVVESMNFYGLSTCNEIGLVRVEQLTI